MNIKIKIAALLIVSFSIITTNSSKAQETITLQKAIELSNTNYPKLKAGRLNIEKQKTLKSAAFDFGTTTFSTGKDEVKGSNAGNVTNFGISQSDIDIFGMFANIRLQKAELKLAQAELNVTRNQLNLEVTKAYNQLWFYINSLQVYKQIDSVYSNFVRAAQLRFKTGESSKLEFLAASAKYRELQVEIKQTIGNTKAAKQKLKQFLLIEDDFNIDKESDIELDIASINTDLTAENNTNIALYTEKTNIANHQLKQQRSQWLPKLSLAYKNQTVDKISGYYGYEAGLTFSLFNGQLSRTKSAKTQAAIENENLNTAKLELKSLLNQLLAKYNSLSDMQQYYKEEALSLAEEQIKASTLAYQLGDVDYLKFIQSIESALKIKLNYINANYEFRNIKAEIKYLTN